ncbi:MAG: SGNH/GDSL hydrolase family protein [Gammaproteobacteria bacterium]
MRQPVLSTLMGAVMLVSLSCAQARGAAQVPAKTGQHWVSSWGTSLMVPDANNELANASWRDASLRQIVPLSLGGQRLRVRVSNLFGTAPMRIERASIALASAGNPNVDAASLKPLTFAGRPYVTIPAGAEYFSDPVALAHRARADVAVSLHLKEAPSRQTSHPGARAHSFYMAGDRTMEAAWNEPGKTTRWYQLADIEVEAPRGTGALVAMGDSITDGYGVQPDTNLRWTDALVRRLIDAKAPPLAVINGGIGGNRMLADGLGPNLMARFEREVLGRSGVTHALVLIGVNDLGVQHRNKEDTPDARKAMVDQLMDAHRQLVERAHARGICVIGATVAPYGGNEYYNPGPDNDADRRALNDWIRGSNVFDAVADVDAALRDPAQPQRLLARLDSGDHLHPSAEGYRAIANAVPLAALRSCAYTK